MSFIDVDPQPLGWYMGQAAPERPLADIRKQIVQDAIVVLTKANQRAKQVAAQAVANSTLLTRSRTEEWARTFTSTVEGMVVRLITVGSDGRFPFEKNAKLIDVIPNYIDEEARLMASMQEELLSISAGLRQAAEALASQVGEQAAAIARAAARAALNEFKKDPGTGGVVLAAGALVGLIALAYVWRSFR